MIFESTFKTVTDFLHSSHVGTNDIFTPIILNLVFPLITSPEPPNQAFPTTRISPPQDSAKAWKFNHKKVWGKAKQKTKTNKNSTINPDGQVKMIALLIWKKKSRWLLYFIITNKKQKTSIKNIDMNPFKISSCCGYYFIFMWHNILPLRKPVTSKAAKSTFKPWRLGHSELAEVEEKVQAFFIIITTYCFFWSKILLIIIHEFFWSKIATHPWWIFLEHYRSYIYCNCSSVDVDEKVPHLMFCGCWWESNMILRAKFKTGVLQSFFLGILVRSTKVKSKKHWNVWNTVKPL